MRGRGIARPRTMFERWMLILTCGGTRHIPRVQRYAHAREDSRHARGPTCRDSNNVTLPAKVNVPLPPAAAPPPRGRRRTARPSSEAAPVIQPGFTRGTTTANGVPWRSRRRRNSTRSIAIMPSTERTPARSMISGALELRARSSCSDTVPNRSGVKSPSNARIAGAAGPPKPNRRPRKDTTVLAGRVPAVSG